MTGYDLPLVNASLNGSSAVLLILGYIAVKSGMIRLHKAAMLTALAASGLFLASYLYYHIAVRHGQATRYVGDWRSVYLTVLLSHTFLAAIAAPLAVATAWLGLTDRLKWHRRVARVTLPIWLYVSVSGVAVYLFLKDLYPTH